MLPKFKGPYHICVRFYGVLHDTCVLSQRASVPAAVQPDQGAAAVVACESTICKFEFETNIGKYINTRYKLI